MIFVTYWPSGTLQSPKATPKLTPKRKNKRAWEGKEDNEWLAEF